MDTHELTAKVFQYEKTIAEHQEKIHTLFNQQKNIEKIASSTQELALSVKELAGRVNDVDDRLELIESEKRQKGYALWQIVMSALIGGVITYVITAVLY